MATPKILNVAFFVSKHCVGPNDARSRLFILLTFFDTIYKKEAILGRQNPPKLNKTVSKADKPPR